MVNEPPMSDSPIHIMDMPQQAAHLESRGSQNMYLPPNLMQVRVPARLLAGFIGCTGRRCLCCASMS